jgi:hypothetical protein
MAHRCRLAAPLGGTDGETKPAQPARLSDPGGRRSAAIGLPSECWSQTCLAAVPAYAKVIVSVALLFARPLAPRGDWIRWRKVIRIGRSLIAPTHGDRWIPVSLAPPARIDRRPLIVMAPKPAGLGEGNERDGQPKAR